MPGMILKYCIMQKDSLLIEEICYKNVLFNKGIIRYGIPGIAYNFP